MGANASGKTIVFSYNEDGSRASKTVNGTRTDYIYNGSKVMRETSGGIAIDFIYDADGRPFAMKRNGAYYYYILNLQGDVIRLVNSSGATVASYEYDPYGKVISATGSMAAINPLRYRGYYYDQETGMYFLQSRYYDPAICRFINADSFASTGEGVLGNNMFAYCLNDPISRKDTQGTASFDVVLDGVESPFDDWLEGVGRGGYAYAYNPIDAGYRYGVDLSVSSNSSLYGGIQQSGYATYGAYSNPASTTSGPASKAKACSNPYGRKGGPAHQNTIQAIKYVLISKGYTVIEEYGVNTVGGYKNTRYLDIYASKGSSSFGIQVGLATRSGLPVARERRALEDIARSGIVTIFVRYN